MVKKGIVLGHVISSDGIDLDKTKIDLIANLFPPTYVNDIRSFHGHTGFYHRFVKDSIKIAKALSNLLAKNVSFHFYEECLQAFTKLKKILTTAPILHPLIWVSLLS